MSVNKFVTLLLLCVASFGMAQEKESDRLRKKQEELQKKISFTEKLLESTKSDQTNLTQNLTLIERKIEYRQDLLNNIQIQLSQLDADITDLTKEIEYKKQEIEHQKEQYRRMIRQAYKMRDANASLVFILSSESFNQANKRMEYLNQLKKYREDQIQKILKNIEDLEAKLAELETKKADKQN